MNTRSMKRAMRKAQGIPEKNALSPKNTRGRAKGPARSPTQREAWAMKRAAAKARAEAEAKTEQKAA